MKKILIAVLFSTLMRLGSFSNTFAQKENSTMDTYSPNWESLSNRNPEPEWFRDSKFGIYFHWGVYSVPAISDEWYPRHMYSPNLPEKDWEQWGQEVYGYHNENFGSPSEFGYPDFVPMFTAENFDAVEWADLFKRAGAQFAGPIAEHHDGFAIWNSKYTTWNVADRGPKRDITGELAEAIRKEGMKFITTFHHARNNLWKPEGEDWTGHYEYVKKNFPALLENKDHAILYGYMPREAFLEV